MYSGVNATIHYMFIWFLLELANVYQNYAYKIVSAYIKCNSNLYKVLVTVYVKIYIQNQT